MRACLVNNFPKHTGAGKYAFNLFFGLRKLDPEVEMHYFGTTKENYGGLKTRQFNFNFPILDSTLKSIYLIPKKVPLGHDIYHATNQFIAGTALTRKPCIVTCLDIIPLTEKKDFSFPVKIFLKKTFSSLKEANHILAISNYTKKQLEEKLDIESGNITVTHLGFDKRIFKKTGKKSSRKKLDLPQNVEIILNVGSEEPRKGVELGLNAFQRILKNHPNALFVRVGEKTNKIQSTIKKLGLEQKVVYLNGLSETMLCSVYNSSDVLLFCSRQEGFGFPLLEASACELPIVCHDNSSISEVVGKNAFFAGDYSKEGFGEALLECLENEKKSKKLVSFAKKKSEDFSWEKCSRETYKVYEKFRS